MAKEQIKEELDELKQKLKTIEWDIKHNKIISKEAQYDQIKTKLKDLEK